MLPDLCPDLTRIENPITPTDGTRESTFEKTSRNVTESKEYAMPDELKTDFDFFQEEFRKYRGLEFNEFQHLYRIFTIFVNSIKYNMMPIFNDAIGQTAQASFQNDWGSLMWGYMSHSIIMKTFFRILSNSIPNLHYYRQQRTNWRIWKILYRIHCVVMWNYIGRVPS